jgi:hypothetical protein
MTALRLDDVGTLGEFARCAGEWGLVLSLTGGWIVLPVSVAVHHTEPKLQGMRPSMRLSRVASVRLERSQRGLVRVLLRFLREAEMSGNKQLKKDGRRKEKKVQARKRDFEQPIVGAASPQRAQDTSNLSDNGIADRERTRKEQE